MSSVIGHLTLRRSSKSEKKSKKSKKSKKKEYRCDGCDESIDKRKQPYLKAAGRLFHESHFSCSRCKIIIGPDEQYMDWTPIYYPQQQESTENRSSSRSKYRKSTNLSGSRDSRLYYIMCVKCSEEEHHQLCASKTVVDCKKCKKNIDMNKELFVSLDDSFWHTSCFSCSTCRRPLTTPSILSLQGSSLVDNNNNNLEIADTKRSHARTRSQSPSQVETLTNSDIKEQNKHQVVDSCTVLKNGDLCCQLCYLSEFTCESCNRLIEGHYVEPSQGDKYHSDCFHCASCQKVLTNEFFEIDFDELHKSTRHLRGHDDNHDGLSNNNTSLTASGETHKDQYICQICYLKILMLVKCTGCKKRVYTPISTNSKEPTPIPVVVRIAGRFFHPECGKCYGCSKTLADEHIYYEMETIPYCIRCAAQIQLRSAVN